MSKNIEMNYKIDSGYEVIYPNVQTGSISINENILSDYGDDIKDLDGVLSFLGKFNLNWWLVYDKIDLNLAHQVNIVIANASSSTEITKVYCSSSLDMTGNSPKLSEGFTSVNISYSLGDSGINNLLRNKYWCLSSSGEGVIYYSDNTDDAYIDYYSGKYEIRMDGSAVTFKVASDATTNYVYDKDKNKYPDNGFLNSKKYVYKGIPYNGIIGASRIETGSYIGNGGYGSQSANKLIFGFCPRFLILWDATSYMRLSIAIKPRGADLPSVTLSNTRLWERQTDTNSITWGDNYVSWYGSDAEVQYNISGRTFYYCCIGD